MKIKNKIISDDSATYVIAEIGINHNGSISKAMKMIDYAAESGCAAVKFQTFYLDEMLLKNTKLANYQKKTGFQNMTDLLRKYNLSYESFKVIKKYCDKKKITFLSTPFDEKSAIFLNKIDVPAFKISSGDIDNFLLLSTIKKFKKPIILSTGMSVISEVKNTVKFLSLKRNELAILHCISDYPTKVSDTQLANILLLKKMKYVVGFSDHTMGDNSSCVAVALGANIIEKHITLDKNLPGPDHVCSLSCKDLQKFVENLNNVKTSISKTLRKLTKQEEITKLVARKSLYFRKDLNKNHKIKYDDLISLRPFNYGISPSMYKKIVNKKLSQKVKKYSKIKFSNIKN